MTSSRALMLLDFFADGARDLSRLATTQQALDLRQQLELHARQLPWTYVLEKIEDAFDELLEVPLEDIIRGAWHGGEYVGDQLQYSRRRPTETFMVPLLEHAIASTHEPRIEVRVGDHRLGAIRFHVEIALVLVGAVLTLRGGRIVELRTGTGEGRGAVTVGGTPLLERSNQPVTLPSVISWKPAAPGPADVGDAG